MYQRSRRGTSMSLSLGRSATSLVLLLMASPAVADVSDEVLSVPGMWLQAVLIGSIAILLGRFRWWLGLPLMILPIVIALSTVWLEDLSGMGPEIVEELGHSYFTHFYASALLAAIMVGIGVRMGWRRRSRMSKEGSPD